MAFFNLPYSWVKSIAFVMDDGDLHEYATVREQKDGLIFEICVDGSSCTRCAKAKHFLSYQYNLVICAKGGNEGNQIKVINNGKVPRLCVLEVFGKS